MLIILCLFACSANEKYTINFYDGQSLIESKKVDKNYELEFPNFSKDGYEIVGYYSLDGKQYESGSKVSSNLDLYVKLELKNYSIIYYNVDGLINPNQNSYTILDDFQLLEVEKENYSFMVWYLDSSFETKITEIKNMTGDLKLYAKFKHNVDVIAIDNFTFNDGIYYMTTSDARYKIYLDESLENEAMGIISLNAGENFIYIKVISNVDESSKVILASVTLNKEGHNVKLYYNNNLIIDDTFVAFNASNIKELGFELENNCFYTDKKFINKWDGNLNDDVILYANMNYVDFRVENGSVVGMNHDVNFLFNIKFLDSLNASKIAKQCFQSNLNILNVDFNNAISEIGEQAFFNCRNLVSINLEGVRIIGDSAFTYCDVLTSVNIVSSVYEIEGYAFKSCHKLNSITFEEGIEIIGTQAFSNTSYGGITTLQLPNSLKKIGDSAFSGHQYLQSIKMSDNIEYIGNFVFADSSALTNLEFNSTSVNYFGKSFISSSSAYYLDQTHWYLNGLYIGKYLIDIKDLSNVAQFNVKDDTLGIASGVGTPNYSQKAALKELSIESPNLVFIGDEVFASQTLLTNVNINCPKVRIIGVDFLKNSKYLSSSEFVVSNGLLLKVNSTSTEITLPDGVSIIAPGSINSSVTTVKNTENLVAILAKAFTNSKLTSFCFGNKLEYIGELAFNWCSNLKIDVLDITSVKYIADNAFNQCKLINTIIINSEAEYIGSKLFNYDNNTSHNIFIYGDYINPKWDGSFNQASGGIVNTYFYSETYKEGTWHYQDGNAQLW